MEQLNYVPINFLYANNIKGKNNIKFSVVRYGNVMGSRFCNRKFRWQKTNGKLN